jgi:hypothetical protein
MAENMDVEARRDFSTFELGDNVYELASGLLPEIAECLDVQLGDEPSSDDMFNLVGKLGKNKVLRNNEPVTAIDLETAADLLNRSGVQKPLNRSLWTPDFQVDPDGGFIIVTGAVANWQDRTAKLVANGIKAGTLSKTTHIITGSRVMGTKPGSEQSNPNVQAFLEEKGKYPTETQYAERYVIPKVKDAGGDVILTSYDTDSGDKIAANFAKEANFSADSEEQRTMFIDGSQVTFARVANAGIQLAVQFRKAIREHVSPDFDGYRHLPEVFVVTDGFPIARTPEEVADPANFQSPYTGLRQAVLTAKMLHEAAA